jgi:hypothetical protein
MSLTNEEQTAVRAVPLPQVTNRNALCLRYRPLVSEALRTLNTYIAELSRPLEPSPGPLPAELIVLVTDEERERSYCWPLCYRESTGIHAVYNKIEGRNILPSQLEVKESASDLLALTQGSPDKILLLLTNLRTASNWAIRQGTWRREESARIAAGWEREEARLTRELMEAERESLGRLEAEVAYRALAKPE